MKRLQIIVILLLAVLAACTPQNEGDAVETRHGTSLPAMPSPALTFVDTLMWQRPDSALACLLPYFDTCCRDVSRNVSETENAGISGDVSGNVSTDYNRHYAHLLLAELLYKNDYAQTNRAELLQVVGCYDSLLMADTRGVSPRRYGRRDASQASAKNVSAETAAFLDARAHYINGVGYYEHDSVVEACAEYLKALELMENRFEEKELVGNKAKFMVFDLNRLMELFSSQFMMEPAIECGNQALMYCNIAPTSSLAFPNTLYFIGKQYQKMGRFDEAKAYFEKAMAALENNNNLVYRNIVASKALCDYQMGLGMDQAVQDLRTIIAQAGNKAERLTRHLTIGGIYFEEGMFDSAQYYLEPVFIDGNDLTAQIQSAEYLRILYDSTENKDLIDKCTLFLADHKKSEGESKALSSQLNGLFKGYLDKKQTRQVKTIHLKAVRKTVSILVPALVILILMVVFVVRGRGKRRQLEMEQERASHNKETEALQNDLIQREEQLDSLKKELEQRHLVANQNKIAFLNEPVCQGINGQLRNFNITTKAKYSDYHKIGLDEATIVKLGDAVAKHFSEFKPKLLSLYPAIKPEELLQCYLYLLGLEDKQIAVLRQCSYSTVFRQTKKLQNKLQADIPLPAFVRQLAFS